LIRAGLLLALLMAAAAAIVLLGGDAVLNELAARETRLRALVSEHPAAALAVAFVAYVLVAGLSLPGAAALTVLYGWLFGFWPAVVLVSFASTTGATVAFLLSRYVLGAAIQTRYGEQLRKFNEAMEREGAFYLFTLRLIPQVPFFVINAVMGLTKLRTTTFWWVSQLGMLPGTCVYVLAGASVPSLAEISKQGLGSILDWRLMLALILLGIVPLALRWLVRYFRPPRASDRTS
jgi:uncharacterized membrane protein YdjX (TVP38/TMEM64 family)